jgi:hypothetical protein
VQVKDKKIDKACWYYPDPVPDFILVKNYIAFYAGKMDHCLVNGEKVIAQPGGFYGGWITKNITGPFKGGPGTMFW